MRTASSLAAYMHRKVGSWASFQWDDGARPLSATPSSTSDEALLGSDDLEAGPGGDGSEKVASRASTSTAFPPRSGTWSGTWRARAGGDKGAESPLGGWARLVVVLLVGFVFGRHFSGQRPELLRTARAGDVREGLWSEYGNDELSVVGTKEEVDLSLPICERTMLIDWVRPLVRNTLRRLPLTAFPRRARSGTALARPPSASCVALLSAQFDGT